MLFTPIGLEPEKIGISSERMDSLLFYCHFKLQTLVSLSLCFPFKLQTPWWFQYQSTLKTDHYATVPWLGLQITFLGREPLLDLSPYVTLGNLPIKNASPYTVQGLIFLTPGLSLKPLVCPSGLLWCDIKLMLFIIYYPRTLILAGKPLHSSLVLLPSPYFFS